MEEGIGETSGVAKAYPPPPPPNPESPMRKGGISKILDKGSAVKFLGRPNNQQFQIEYPDQEPSENFWHLFEQMAQVNQQQSQTSTLEYPIVDPISNAPIKSIPLQNLPTFHGLISEDPDAFCNVPHLLER
jgi:hypothetical protein